MQFIGTRVAKIGDLTAQARQPLSGRVASKLLPRQLVRTPPVRRVGPGMVAGGPVLLTLDRSGFVLDANIGQRFPARHPLYPYPLNPGPLASPGEWPVLILTLTRDLAGKVPPGRQDLSRVLRSTGRLSLQ